MKEFKNEQRQINTIIFVQGVCVRMSADNTTLGDSMHKLRLAEDGTAIEATITRIDGAAMFSTGWIDTGYLYETPTLYITCDTSLGKLRLHADIKNIDESGLKPFLENAPFDPTKQVDLASLIGETLYVAPDENKATATIGWEREETNYNESNTVILETENLRYLDEVSIDSKFPTSMEPRTLEEMNSLLTIEMIRAVSGTHGWIEVPFEYAGKSNSTHFFTAEVYDETVYWAFDDTVRGIENIGTFLSELGINYTPEEFLNETVWMKPLRDIHFTNRPEDNHRIDTDEFWVIADAPQNPVKEETFLEKLKDFFSIPSGTSGVEVSVGGNRSRKAKSSKTKEVPRPNQSQTQHNHSNERLEFETA